MELIETMEKLLSIVEPFYIEKVEKDEKQKEVHIFIKIQKNYRPKGQENSNIHSYKSRLWEHLNLFEFRCFIHGEVPIYQDKENEKLHQLEVDFSRKHSRFTLLYEQKVMELMKLHHCFKKVGKQLKLYPQRVESIYHFYTQHLNENLPVKHCERIGYDETSSRKGHDYISVFVDMDTHEILTIEDGKSGEAVAAFALQHPNPSAIKEVSIDMSPAFIAAAQSNFPNAHTTFDKWHVIKLLHKHLEDISNKSASVYEHLNITVDKIGSFFQESEEVGKAQLCFMADLAQEKAGNNPFTKSIYRHFEGIVRYFTSRLTNGVLEGINSTIQTIKRVAKGFRNVENFKKMIRFVFEKNTSYTLQTN